MKKLTLALALIFSFICSSAQTEASIFDVSNPKRVSVHDPSVVVGYKRGGKITGVPADDAKKVYYIFGSHRAFAHSEDLQNWTNFNNNISSQYATIFKEDAKWAAHGGAQGNTSYNVSGNLWAPDVIWNKQMKKWCMYMSVNGDNWYSSIVLLTAESLDGNWTRVGPIVYSGFTNTAEAKETDFFTVCSDLTSLPSRYNLNRNGVHTYGMNAIDPCVFYDEDGNLWMTYGSWFGGIYMLRLDPATGLRDYSYTYTTTNGTAEGAVSDIYQGIKIAGGNHCSGEAPYVQYINDRYYLFVTYGGLTANGGYNMRVFSSKDVTGPYKDIYGHSAIWSTSNSSAGDTKKNVGSRLMSYYKISTLGFGYIAQGHNSAIVDEDGRAYVVYHTRFTNAGEGHEVRVHQLFQVANGGLVAAPFEYRGESLADAPYSAAEIAGKYNVIYHQGTDYANLACQEEHQMELTADGQITGYFKGTWTQDADKPYITLKVGTSTYEGVLIEQQMEGLNCKNLCISAIGKSDIPIWAYKDVTDKISEAISGQLPIHEHSVLGRYADGGEFNASAPVGTAITEETGLSVSFMVYGLDSDWNEIGRTKDGKYTMFLSVLRYNGADFYEAAATADSASPVKTDLWTAFLNGTYYATVSFNPNGTISYYRDGVLLFTYAANLRPGYGTASVTPAAIVKAVIKYFQDGKFEFTRSVYNVVVGYSVPYDITGIADVTVDALEGDGQMYNLLGQPVDESYRGIVIRNGKKYLNK